MGLAHSPRIVTDGLVLCLDAGNTKSYPGSGTTWIDLSGNGNNGTLTNGPTFDSGNGGSIVFDGINDFVNCGTGIALGSSWSIAAFANYTVSAGSDILIGRTGDGYTGFTQNYLLYSNSSGKFVCQTSVDSYKGAVGTTTLQSNNWYYVVGTYNSVTKIISVYVNAQLEGSSTALSVNPTTTGTQYVALGADDGLAAGNPFQGKIAVGQIYNRELSAAEIQQNFNALRGRFRI